MTTKGLFDPGLQPERTALAWRRTALTLAVGAVVSFRLLPPVLGLWSLAVGVAGLLLSAATWILAGRRAHRVQQALLGGPIVRSGRPRQGVAGDATAGPAVVEEADGRTRMPAGPRASNGPALPSAGSRRSRRSSQPHPGMSGLLHDRRR